MQEINYRKSFERLKGQAEKIEDLLSEVHIKLSKLKRYGEELEQAQIITQTVATKTQEQFKYHISELVTLCLASVFENPYTFGIDFVQKRNQTEAEIYFEREGCRIDPLTEGGGGAVDVAAFGLRVSLYTMKKNRSQPILVLDEPFSRLKGKETNIKAIQMVKEISRRLNLQVIMVSDERASIEEIEAGADVVHRVILKRGKGKYARGYSEVVSR